eukprot:1986403-Rhodomonas_salina.3
MEQALKRLFLFEKKTNHLEEILLISEVRFIAADDMTLSPQVSAPMLQVTVSRCHGYADMKVSCSQRILGDAVGLHFTWKPGESTIRRVHVASTLLPLSVEF